MTDVCARLKADHSHLDSTGPTRQFETPYRTVPRPHTCRRQDGLREPGSHSRPDRELGHTRSFPSEVFRGVAGCQGLGSW